MEKKKKVAPESSQLGEPPLKQLKYNQVFGAAHTPSPFDASCSPAFGSPMPAFAFEQSSASPFGQTNSVFGAAHTPSPFGASCSPVFGSPMPAFGSSSTPAFGSSSTSFGGSSGFGRKTQNHALEATLPTSIQKLLKEVGGFGSTNPTIYEKQLELVGFFGASFQIWKQSFQTNPFQRATQPSQLALGFGSAPAFCAASGLAEFRATSIPAALREMSMPFSIASLHIITEEDERFESWFAIKGADYCVITADFTGAHTNISQLSGKCVMASCGGFEADAKALQNILFAENLKYEGQHKKSMSCTEMHRLFCHFEKSHPLCGFILLGGLDSEGKGCLFEHYGPAAVSSSQNSGSFNTVPPILKYELPAPDVVARMSETEAVNLAKTVFASTKTGDKLEIVVLNASGIRRESVDPKTGDKLEIVVSNANGQLLSRKRRRSISV